MNAQKIEVAFKNYVSDFEVIKKSNDDDEPEKRMNTINSNPTEKMSVQDYQMFLREIFYDESSYVLVEKERDTEDFFQKLNSYKKVLKLIENYFHQNPNLGRYHLMKINLFSFFFN